MSLYDFGWPDELVDIHFPRGGQLPGDPSLPWYYYLTQQTPTFFQYIGSQLGGHGWQCAPFLPVIRILPIDSQKMTPTSQVGFASLEEAVTRTNNGEPISQDAWGRFNFKNKFFWQVMGKKPPTWAKFANGLPRSAPPQRSVRLYIEETVKKWRDNWDIEAENFNALCNNVQPNGDYGAYGAGPFALPVPGVGYSTFPNKMLLDNPDKYYFGAVPPFVTFERGQALIFKQSFAFKYEIAQLDPGRWNMNKFPPEDTTLLDVESAPTSITGKAGGYAAINFPLTSPVIAGTK